MLCDQNETGMVCQIKRAAMVPWKSLFDWDMNRIYAMLGLNVGVEFVEGFLRSAISGLTDLFQLAIAILTAYLLFLKIRKESNHLPDKKEE